MNDAKVLVVEDEVIIAREICACLASEGYEITGQVASGTDALRSVEEHRPDVVLMDICIRGDIDGVDAATAIRTRHGVPIVFLTAHSDGPTIARAVESEPCGYVIKPFRDRELIAAVAMALHVGRVQQRLRESELRYRTVADFTHDWETWRTPEGNFAYVSPSCEAHSGHNADAFLADAALDRALVHADDRARYDRHIEQETASHDVLGIDYRIVTRSGETRWISHYCRSVVDGGRFLGRRCSNRDITWRKRAEEERERLYREADTALRTREDLLAVASHDLLSPVNGALLLLEALRREAKRAKDHVSKEVVVDAIETAKDSLEHAVRLTRGLLEMSRAAAGKLEIRLEELDFAQVVDDVTARSRVRSRIAECPLTVRLERPVRCRSDRMRLEQVISNLIDNAFKYGAGAPVDVDMRADDATAWIHVRDRGPGISDEHAARIFEPFVRATSEGRGASYGLGLFIVRRIVEALGGEVTVASTVGDGATFTVRLPRGGPETT